MRRAKDQLAQGGAAILRARRRSYQWPVTIWEQAGGPGNQYAKCRGVGRLVVAAVRRENPIQTTGCLLAGRALWSSAMLPEFVQATPGIVRDASRGHAKLSGENALLRPQIATFPPYRPEDRPRGSPTASLG
jgi:hypothetical protein